MEMPIMQEIEVLFASITIGVVIVIIVIMRSLLYKLARIMGDVNAVKKGKIVRRLARRAAGRATGKGMGKVFD